MSDFFTERKKYVTYYHNRARVVGFYRVNFLALKELFLKRSAYRWYEFII